MGGGGGQGARGGGGGGRGRGGGGGGFGRGKEYAPNRLFTKGVGYSPPSFYLFNFPSDLLCLRSCRSKRNTSRINCLFVLLLLGGRGGMWGGGGGGGGVPFFFVRIFSPFFFLSLHFDQKLFKLDNTNTMLWW